MFYYLFADKLGLSGHPGGSSISGVVDKVGAQLTSYTQMLVPVVDATEVKWKASKPTIQPVSIGVNSL